MTIDVTVARAIECEPATVFAYLSDPAHDPEWIGGLIGVHPPGGALTVGSRVERVAGFMGRRIEYELEVIALEPERRIAMRSLRAPFPMAVTYEIAPAGARGAVVSLHVAGGPGGVARAVHPLIARQVRRNLTRDLERLAARIGG